MVGKKSEVEASAFFFVVFWAAFAFDKDDLESVEALTKPTLTGGTCSLADGPSAFFSRWLMAKRYDCSILQDE